MISPNGQQQSLCEETGPEVIFRKSIREMTNDPTHILEARDLCLAAEKDNQMAEEINIDNERSAVTSCEGDKQAIPISSLTSENLSAALALAKAGLRVFPAKPVFNRKTGRWTKPPAVVDWQSVATTNPEQITEWWKQFPDAIPAVPCDRFVVIDADRHGGPDGVIALAALVNEYEHWPDHPTVLTPSGGEHHYFGQPSPPIGNRTGKLPEGIDVRGGVGGFVVGLEAVLPDGSRWQLDPSSLKTGTNWWRLFRHCRNGSKP